MRFARSRELPLLLLGRGSNIVISDRGVRGLVVHVRAEGSRVDGDAYVGRGRRPDGARRHGDAEGRPQRPRVRARHPGLGRRRRVGERRRARLGRPARSSNRRTSSSPTAARRDCRRASSAWPTARAASSTSPADAPAEVVIGARFRLEPAVGGPRSRPASTTSGTGGRPTSRSASRRPAARSGTRAEGPSAGALIDAAGLKGLQEGGATVSGSTPTSSSTTGAARRPTSAGSWTACARRSSRRTAWTSGPEIVFVGDWTGWPWPAEQDVP